MKEWGEPAEWFPRWALALPSILRAPLPLQPVEKSLPGAGLLAHVIVSKYADHLPLSALGIGAPSELDALANQAQGA